MDVDRDPTDLGVARPLSVSELAEVRAQAAEVRAAARRRAAGLVPRARSGAGVPVQRSSGRSLRLLVSCGQCSAVAGRWCRVGRREVVGHLHEVRQAPVDTPSPV